jgi:hypothetical protein
MTAIKFTPAHLIVAGKRIRVSYCAGPWVEGVDPSTIKIRPWTGNYFPAEVRKAFAIENNSDMMTDYCEGDCIRLTSAHPHHAAINEVAPR